MKRLALITSVLLLTAIGAGCGSDSDNGGSGTSDAAKGGTIGLSEFFLKDYGQRQIKDNLEAAAEAAGFKMFTTDANGKPDQQVADVENTLTQGVKAVVINPMNGAAIVPAIKSANAKNIPVFTIDAVPAGGKVALVVRTDNITLGEEAGKEMVRLLKERNGEAKGNILQITGDLTSSNAQDRRKGFENIVKKEPGIKLITKEAEAWDPKAGGDIAQTIISAKNPKIDGVYFHSEFTGAGIIPVLDQLGQKPVGDPGHTIVVGIDGSPDGLKWIREKKVDATVSQPLSDFGNVAFKYGIVPTLKGEKLTGGEIVEEGAIWSPATLDLDSKPGPMLLMAPTLVTSKNVDDDRLWGN